MAAYYNEIDPFAAQWLRNLIAAGHIAPGVVDERSIASVRADDLRGYRQCHFFTGIGVWSYALRLAGWSDDREVWTGSCPCQPFSAAGKGEAYADERHLWPHWLRLIRECRPAVVFGEQVDAAIRTGWLDDVCLSLEELDYAIGAVSFPACSVGAPHIRQRLYFVAESRSTGAGRNIGSLQEKESSSRRRNGTAIACSATLAVADAEREGSQGCVGPSDMGLHRAAGSNGSTAMSGFWADAIWLPCRDGRARPTQPGLFPLAHGAAARMGRLRAYGNAIVSEQAKAFIEAYMQGIA